MEPRVERVALAELLERAGARRVPDGLHHEHLRADVACPAVEATERDVRLSQLRMALALLERGGRDLHLPQRLVAQASEREAHQVGGARPLQGERGSPEETDRSPEELLRELQRA